MPYYLSNRPQGDWVLSTFARAFEADVVEGLSPPVARLDPLFQAEAELVPA